MTENRKSQNPIYKPFGQGGGEIKRPVEKKVGIAEQAVNTAILNRMEKKQKGHWQNDGDAEFAHYRASVQNATPDWAINRDW